MMPSGGAYPAKGREEEERRGAKGRERTIVLGEKRTATQLAIRDKRGEGMEGCLTERERERERGLSKGGETAVDRKRKGKRGNWKGEGVGACARISHVSPRIRERLTSGARRPGGSVSCAISYAALPNFRPCPASTEPRSFLDPQPRCLRDNQERYVHVVSRGRGEMCGLIRR